MSYDPISFDNILMLSPPLNRLSFQLRDQNIAGTLRCFKVNGIHHQCEEELNPARNFDPSIRLTQLVNLNNQATKIGNRLFFLTLASRTLLKNKKTKTYFRLVMFLG